jgi:hypothetical protein
MDIKKLEKEHHELNKKIDAAEKTGIFEDKQLHQMKKEKLILKDKIAIMKARQDSKAKK